MVGTNKQQPRRLTSLWFPLGNRGLFKFNYIVMGVVLLLALFIIISLPVYLSFFDRLSRPPFNGKDVVLVGYLSYDGLSCPISDARRFIIPVAAASNIAVVLVPVIHTPTPYVLYDESGESSWWDNRIFSWMDNKVRVKVSRVKVRGITTNNMLSVCSQGKRQNVPIVKVISVEIL